MDTNTCIKNMLMGPKTNSKSIDPTQHNSGYKTNIIYVCSLHIFNLLFSLTKWSNILVILSLFHKSNTAPGQFGIISATNWVAKQNDDMHTCGCKHKHTNTHSTHTINVFQFLGHCYHLLFEVLYPSLTIFISSDINGMSSL